jgi:hypothetical protein
LHGLELLRDRNRPRKADPMRWAQILADCDKNIRRHRCATEAGWSAVDLFGFDPTDPTPSLAVALRGRELVLIKPEYAAMKGPNGFAWHYRELRGDVPLLWNFNEREYVL